MPAHVHGGVAIGRRLRVDAIVGEGDPRALVAWEPATEVESLGELYISPDATLIALDYTAKTLRGSTPATAVFDVRNWAATFSLTLSGGISRACSS